MMPFCRVGTQKLLAIEMIIRRDGRGLLTATLVIHRITGMIIPGAAVIRPLVGMDLPDHGMVHHANRVPLPIGLVTLLDAEVIPSTIERTPIITWMIGNASGVLVQGQVDCTRAARHDEEHDRPSGSRSI